MRVNSISKWLALAGASLLMMAAAAHADDWKVVQSSGDVWVGADSAAQPVSLPSSASVADGSTVITGAAGRVMLANGNQTMLIGPNSVATVPSDSDQGFVTILQRAGKIEFDVDKQKDPHFAVETPYLAAVVKGTHFAVTIDGNGASVSVDRGLVAVTDLATGETVDTPAGQSAGVSQASGKLTVWGSGHLPTVTQGTARAPLVGSLSTNDLRALQSRAASGAATGSPDPSGVGRNGQASNAGLVVVAGNSGDDGGSNSGGTTDGGSSGGQTVDGSSGSVGGVAVDSASGAGAASQLVFHDVGQANLRFSQNDKSGTAPLAVVLGLGLSVMLAFGIAYLRGRVG